MKFNFSELMNIYSDALNSPDKTLAFDIAIGKGRFLFMMFLSSEDKDAKDNLFIYMRNTSVMRKKKAYGSHSKGVFDIYIDSDLEQCLINELQLIPSGGTFNFETFLNELNNAIPLKIEQSEKVQTLRDNRNVVRTVAVDELDKTVLIGTMYLGNKKPRDRTLRKLYMYTDESEKDVTAFIKILKETHTTLRWTTEDNRYRAADINLLLNDSKKVSM